MTPGGGVCYIIVDKTDLLIFKNIGQFFGKLVERQGRKAIGAKVRGISRMMPAGCFRFFAEILCIPESSKTIGVFFLRARQILLVSSKLPTRSGGFFIVLTELF